MKNNVDEFFRKAETSIAEFEQAINRTRTSDSQVTIIGAPVCPRCNQPCEYESIRKERLDGPNSPARWLYAWVCRSEFHDAPVVVEVQR
jgi:hypothetical protein